MTAQSYQRRGTFVKVGYQIPRSGVFGGQLLDERFAFDQGIDHDGKRVFFHDVGGVKRVDPARVAQVDEIELAQLPQHFHEGQRVVISKYGGTYVGRIVKVGRTRAQVKFMLASGRYKVATVALVDVQLND